MFQSNCPVGPVVLRKNYGFARRDIAEIRRTLDDNVPALCSEWRGFMVPDDEFEPAVARAAQRRQLGSRAVAARYDRRIGRVVIRLSSGLEVAFAPHDAQGLENAKPAQLDEIEISPSGCGIHFPKVDADIYLPSLLEGFRGSRQWMAAHPPAAGTQSTSGEKVGDTCGRSKRAENRRKTAAR